MPKKLICGCDTGTGEACPEHAAIMSTGEALRAGVAIIDRGSSALSLVEEAIAAWPQLDLDPSKATDSELYISGADMVEWFAGWRARAVAAVRNGARPESILPHGLDSTLDNVEVAAIITGLRLIEKTGVPPSLQRIFTSEFTHDGLSDDDIMALCERISKVGLS